MCAPVWEEGGQVLLVFGPYTLHACLWSRLLAVAAAWTWTDGDGVASAPSLRLSGTFDEKAPSAMEEQLPLLTWKYLQSACRIKRNYNSIYWCIGFLKFVVNPGISIYSFSSLSCSWTEVYDEKCVWSVTTTGTSHCKNFIPQEQQQKRGGGEQRWEKRPKRFPDQHNPFHQLPVGQKHTLTS